MGTSRCALELGLPDPYIQPFSGGCTLVSLLSSLLMSYLFSSTMSIGAGVTEIPVYQVFRVRKEVIL